MNMDEFKKMVKPAGKRSRLEPFRDQIFELKAQGYTDNQVCDYLSSNNITISRQSLYKFVNKKTHGNSLLTLSSESINSNNPDNTALTIEPTKVEFVSEKAKRDQIANKYIKDGPTSPVLRKLLKEK